MESLQDYGQEYKNTEIVLVQVCLEELQEYLAHIQTLNRDGFLMIFSI